MFEYAYAPPWPLPPPRDAHPSRIAAMARQALRAEPEGDGKYLQAIILRYHGWSPFTQEQFLKERERLRHDSSGQP